MHTDIHEERKFKKTIPSLGEDLVGTLEDVGGTEKVLTEKLENVGGA